VHKHYRPASLTDDVDDKRFASRLRWRFTLQAMWERKLDEVLALAGTRQGLSPAGDKLAGGQTSQPPSRAGRAFEELGTIADAINRIDLGTYGLCKGCEQPMKDEWLARHPESIFCDACAMPRPRAHALS
jgi:hypothetical protein